MSDMPSPRHDALINMFSARPRLAVEILRDLMGVDLPDTPLVRQESTTFSTRPSDDIEADLVFTLGPPQAPVHAIIVEIQQDTSMEPRQLARYAAALWLLLGCDVSVLVVCPDRAVAEYYARPIESGLTGYRLRAWVLGPDGVPAITDRQQAAAHLELSAMSVMVHGRNRKVVEAFTMAVADTRDEHAPKYYEYAYSMAAPEIRRLLEEIEGRTEEAARIVLLVLTARGLDVPDDKRTQITTCTDLAQLETWATRAATAQDLRDLFSESGGQAL
ncbi:hypothetical protein OHA25_20155 [Nonomuraea sp. NBC_00507]|uniref:hypothetical protein n=1 Tax=Nonomuraea sp. NBC_00507 TaxID=2976002 RepID=UPI002E16BA07